MRHATNPSLVGKVVSSRIRGPRWVYLVRWDGYDHNSGEYGIRSLERLTRV